MKQQDLGLDLSARRIRKEVLLELSIYRDFCGLSSTHRIPDQVNILCFRHLLEEHSLSPQILQIINDKLSMQGIILETGTVVNATLIAVPSSTENKGANVIPKCTRPRRATNGISE